MNLAHETRLASVLLPIFDPQRSNKVTKEFAMTVSTEFIKILLSEGDRAAKFVIDLQPEQKKKLYIMLNEAGLGGLSYVSNVYSFSIPETH